ncbi:MAG: EAL domain-containing protein [Rhodoferax sp.]|nr:EAL domain-containing protein [Rhodoferax sp.]
MQIFKPFLTLLGRLSVSRKLTLIYLLDLITVIYISGILVHEKYLAIDFVRKEIVGVAYERSVRQLVLPALIENALNSAQSQASWRLFNDQRLQHDEALKTAQASQALDKAWRAYAQSATHLPAQRQTLIDDTRTLLTTVANQSNLILDPDLDSYYCMSLTVLRFPELTAVMNETAVAMHQASRSAPGADLQSTQLLILAGRLDAIRQGISADYLQAYTAGSPALRASLLNADQALGRHIEQMLGLVRDAAQQQRAPVQSAAFDDWHRRSLQTLATTWQKTSQTLDDLLQQRVDGLFTRMWLHLGTALLLLMGILSLVYTVARQISSPLKQLAGVAEQVRQSSNYALRAAWSSHDEIGHLVNTFNGMLGQLDEDRAVKQELAASARAAQAQTELVEAIPIAMVVTSIPDHQVLHANEPAQPWMAGCTLDPWRRGLEPGVRARFFQRLADHDRVDEFEVRWLAGAEPSWAVLSARRIRFQGVDAVLTSFTPINVLKLMEQRLQLWAKVFEASSEGIVIMDAEQKIISVNQAFCKATSYGFYEVIGEHLTSLLGATPEVSATEIGQEIASSIDRRHEWQGEVRLTTRGGLTYPALLMISAVRDDVREDLVSHYIAICIDITDRKKAEERVQFLALHDVLTALPNRALCIQTLDAALAQARRSGECIGVLFIDLDRFKAINDTLGHHIGDGLLRSVAARLQQAVRSGDTVSRLGGDEFVVILRGLKDASDAHQQAEQRIIPLIRQVHQVQDHELYVSCSVGVATYPQDGTDRDELMRRADAAMYNAKSAGRDGACLFDTSIDHALQARQTLEQNLKLALERQEFTLHYQPKIDAKTRAMVGVEALLRWHSPELGQVSPARFIPIAEETGLIKPIGAWVLQQACAQWAAWRDLGYDHWTMAINLSALQLADPSLLDLMRDCITLHRCEPGRLEFEITESHLMQNPNAAAGTLQAIKALGVTLSIDDFGTGYSSLAYLKRFPIDKLKIDQSFVRDMQHDPADLAIVRATIALGHELGLKLVAEGVETPGQAQQLTVLGVEELQGYWFSRPLEANALLQWASQPHDTLDRRA